jgi:hypothetical protein
VLAFTFYVGQHALALGSIIVLAEPNRRPVAANAQTLHFGS